MRHRGSMLALLTALFALLISASAQAVAWVTGPPISPAGRIALTPTIGLTPAGERVVAWQQRDGVNTQGIGIRVAGSAARFGPEQLIPATTGAFLSQTVGSDGTDALVWVDSTSPQTNDLHIARRLPGQATFTESSPFPLGATAAGPPSVAVQDGVVYVAVPVNVFQAGVGSSAIRIVRLSANANTPQAIDGPSGGIDHASFNTGTQPSDAVDEPWLAVGAGRLYVVWERTTDSAASDGTGQTLVRSASVPLSGGGFTPPATLDTITSGSRGAALAEPVIAAHGSQVQAVWARKHAKQIVHESLTSPGPPRAWGVGLFPSELHAGIDPAGALIIAWVDLPNDFTEAVREVAIPPSGPAGPIHQLTPQDTERELDAFMVGSDGTALVLTDLAIGEAFEDGNERVQATLGSSGRGFGSLEDVSGMQDRIGPAAFDTAAAVLGARGRAVAAWSAGDGSADSDDRIFFSERDATPPSVHAVSVPGSTRVGHAVSMSASASDALSGVSISWDFGDGASARGATVSHSYGAPGRYRITVQVRDGSGNTVSSRSTIRVNAGAPVVSRFGLTRSRFRVAANATPVIANAKSADGTAFKLRVDQHAMLVISVRRRNSGKELGTIIRTHRGPGSIEIPFSGRIGRARLAPGAYRASVVAVGVFGNRSRPRTTRFTVMS